MRTKILVTISLLTLLGVTYAYAQGLSARANIPFQFTASGKVLPAGQYDFTREANDEAIRVAAVGKGPSVIAVAITRLGAGIHNTPQDSHIVFDKIGETYTLSEVWFPGVDGFMLHITKEKHEHRMVNVPR